MLQVSDSAVAALEEARNAQDVPDDFGVRIFGHRDEEGNVRVALGFVEEPLDGDEVTEQAGTPIYIAEEIADPLSDSMIDVADAPEGAQLVVRPQETEA